MLRSDLCDYSDAYIVVKGETTVAGESNNSRKNRPLAFKNNVPFIGCISKINNQSEMTNHTKTNHLIHLIDPTFTKVNKLFVLSFENEEGRTFFSKYYVPKVEIKYFNVLIDGKVFLMSQ